MEDIAKNADGMKAAGGQETALAALPLPAFLARHGFSDHSEDVHSIVNGLVQYMKTPAMLKTYMTPPDAMSWRQQIYDAPLSPFPLDATPSSIGGGTSLGGGRQVIVIDAGGTNFRSCLVKFDGAKELPAIIDEQKCPMPGIEREYKRDEFYGAIADRIERFRGASDTVCLCFSYAVQMLPSGDGRVLKFSKEIKAQDAAGTMLGASLKKALKERGWGEMRIVIVNDTTAALIAGKVFGKSVLPPASFASFILGTGINSSFLDAATNQIAVTEIGSYSNISMSDFDKDVDSTSKSPGEYILEKQCSGAYLGRVASAMLRKAKEEGLISRCKEMTLADVDKFLHCPEDCTFFGAQPDALSGMASDVQRNGNARPINYEEERKTAFYLCEAAVKRAAVLSAAVIAAAVILTGKGAVSPVCIECNGTTFHKTYKLKERVIKILDEELCRKRGLHFVLSYVENDITLGTAAASLIRETIAAANGER